MQDPLIRYYREHDDFLRYAIGNTERTKAISKLYSENRQRFGTRVLDIACGGGVLGFVLEGKGHHYVGVDKNPDMIMKAKSYFSSPKSSSSIVLGDVKSIRLPGVFDTVALLGNALIHFNVSELSKILKNLERNVHVGTSFIAEYRDVVSIMFDGKWDKKYVERRGHRMVTSLTRGIEPRQGEIVIDSSMKGQPPLKFAHAIWSPFIVESVMSGHSWKLAKRAPADDSYVWLDIYRKERAE